MTNHKIIRMLMVLAGMLLAGCSGDDDEVKREAKNAEISISTNLSKMLTRVTTIDSNSELQAEDIKIDAYFHNSDTKYLDGVKLHYDATAWKFWSGDPGSETHYYWPIEGSVYEPSSANITVPSLDFVGFCPYDKPSYIGTPTYVPATGVSFTCDMSSCMTLASQASLQEYLIAALNDQTYDTQTAAGGALPMVFKHPFALVKFTITSASGEHVQINSISIADLKTGGTCTYDGTDVTWGSYTGSGTMSIDQVLKVGETTETTPFMVIPNSYSSKFLTVNATWDDWSDVTITDYGTNVDFNWEPGHIYTYNLTLDKLVLKVDIEKFTEQW